MTHFFSVACCVLAFFVTNPAQSDLARQTFSLGTEAARDGKFEQAIESYQKALIQIDPNANDTFLASAHSNIAICHYRLGRHDAAIPHLKTAILVSGGQYPNAFYALGMVYSDIGRRDEAVVAFRRVLKLRGDDAEAWFDLASVLVLQHDYSGAEKAFQRSIRYGTIASHAAHNDLGVLLAYRGDWRAAESEFRTALIESNGEMVEAKNNLQISRSYLRQPDRTLVGSIAFRRRTDRRSQI